MGFLFCTTFYCIIICIKIITVTDNLTKRGKFLLYRSFSVFILKGVFCSFIVLLMYCGFHYPIFDSIGVCSDGILLFVVLVIVTLLFVERL